MHTNTGRPTPSARRHRSRHRHAPEMGSLLETDYLMGLGTLDERMLILVNIDKLMTSDDMGLTEKTAA